MRRLHILIPAGGLGSRFTNAGWDVPKPLIPVDGMPMFLKALSSFDPLPCRKAITLIIRAELDEKYAFRSHIKQLLPDANVVIIPSLTRGSVETCLAAAHLIEPDDGLVVLDCDLWFNSPAYMTLISETLSGERKIDGGLLTFENDSDRYSYVLSSGTHAVRTAEKKVISNTAIAGAYYFSTGQIFLNYARRVLQSPPDPEYYTSHIFNLVLSDGGLIDVAPVESYASFGTPEELARYQGHSI